MTEAFILFFHVEKCRSGVKCESGVKCRSGVDGVSDRVTFKKRCEAKRRAVPTLRVVGIDRLELAAGKKYGTVLVDLQGR